MSGIVKDIQTTGFSIIYSITLLLNNLIVYTIFGLVGGVIGVQIINSKYKSK
jgi:hypothetical protein